MDGAAPNSLLSMQVNDPLAQPEFNLSLREKQELAVRQHDANAAYVNPSSSPSFGVQQYPRDMGSPYGSPYGDGRFASSPARGGLSALDAPLPKSFDSQGISQAARHGPFASSVPSRFGIESPSFASPSRIQLGNGALRDTPFGDTAHLDGVLHGLGSSPRDNAALDFSKRPLHSERFARTRPMNMASSLGIRPTHFQQDTDESDGESDAGAGEDLLPSSLHDLIPQEKLRRSSRNAIDDDNNPLPMTSAQRRAISNGVTPQDSKAGSLSPHSGSPSRYSSLWAARSGNSKTADAESSFGHVGSPLRPSNLRTSSSTTATLPNTAAPPSMPALADQLQRTSLGDDGKTNHVTSAGPGLSSHTLLAAGAARGISSDRGIGNGVVGPEKIDEETMFSMEEDGDDTAARGSSASLSQSDESAAFRRGSNPVYDYGRGSTTLGPIGGQRPSK